MARSSSQFGSIGKYIAIIAMFFSFVIMYSSLHNRRHYAYYKPVNQYINNDTVNALINVNVVVEDSTFHEKQDEKLQCDIRQYEANINKVIIDIRKLGLRLSKKFIKYLELKKQIEYIVDNNIKGDVYETGIWKGGTAIFMYYVMTEYEKCKSIQSKRHFWYFDSFEGFVGIDTRDQALTDFLHRSRFFVQSLDSVKRNFQRFVELTDKIHFVKGYFEETIPKHCNSKGNINPISILRLNGDLYSSTKVALDYLYKYVAVNGFVIIADYGLPLPKTKNTTRMSKDAVDEFIPKYNISLKESTALSTVKFWQRE